MSETNKVEEVCGTAVTEVVKALEAMTKKRQTILRTAGKQRKIIKKLQTLLALNTTLSAFFDLHGLLPFFNDEPNPNDESEYVFDTDTDDFESDVDNFDGRFPHNDADDNDDDDDDSDVEYMLMKH